MSTRQPFPICAFYISYLGCFVMSAGLVFEEGTCLWRPPQSPGVAFHHCAFLSEQLSGSYLFSMHGKPCMHIPKQEDSWVLHYQLSASASWNAVNSQCGVLMGGSVWDNLDDYFSFKLRITGLTPCYWSLWWDKRAAYDSHSPQPAFKQPLYFCSKAICKSLRIPSLPNPHRMWACVSSQLGSLPP